MEEYVRLPRHMKPLYRDAVVVPSTTRIAGHYKGALIGLTGQPFWVCRHRHSTLAQAEACGIRQREMLTVPGRDN